MNLGIKVVDGEGEYCLCSIKNTKNQAKYLHNDFRVTDNCTLNYTT
jgi:hypothetical protein